ncbi:MAG: hypothetical protein ACK5NW_14140 [Ottowia sp.]
MDFEEDIEERLNSPDLGAWAAEDIEAKYAKNEDSVVISTSP